ncbi:carbohydrate-binding protein [Streptomyces fradiae]|uniref:CBM35 domain-containing protein n=1 Tax=Streptomyces fradiae TaxID=1906 RepID=UPI002018BACD|nr:CBM35 domain-containing protein [Streptomyces fradiae]UQS31898.1 carbohydrate-binding protein [Streptomyces fradiae]
MAAGNHGNGAGTPEDDDPFGYLYADGQDSGAQRGGGQGGYGYPGPAGAAQPGRPRTSYNQVRAVGERPRPQAPPPQQPYGQPHPQYAAPETYPGGAPTRPVPPQGGGRGGRSGGPNTRGLLIGAVAVVLVVVGGITAAVISNKSDEEKKAEPAPSAPADPADPSGDPSPSPSSSSGGGEGLPKQDAATLQLTPPARLATDVKGAQGPGGAYVTDFNAVGAAVTWKANVEAAGRYKLYVRYSIPAVDANATLTVNGKPNHNPLGLKNFIHSSDANWEKNWQTTWAPIDLKQGPNEIKISCETGNQCNVILDWLEVRPRTAA